jgi:predicted metal-dependent hydrolase
LELAKLALGLKKIDKGFYKAVERTHERMKRGGKDGERAKRQLIIAAAMPHFSGLQASTSH